MGLEEQDECDIDINTQSQLDQYFNKKFGVNNNSRFKKFNSEKFNAN